MTPTGCLAHDSLKKITKAARTASLCGAGRHLDVAEAPMRPDSQNPDKNNET